MNSVKSKFNFGFFFFRLLLIAFGFFFWFIILSMLGAPVAGVVIGLITASIAFILTIPNKEQCANVNTRHAGTHADELKKFERFMHSKEHLSKEHQQKFGRSQRKDRNS